MRHGPLWDSESSNGPSASRFTHIFVFDVYLPQTGSGLCPVCVSDTPRQRWEAVNKEPRPVLSVNEGFFVFLLEIRTITPISPLTKCTSFMIYNYIFALIHEKAMVRHCKMKAKIFITERNVFYPFIPHWQPNISLRPKWYCAGPSRPAPRLLPSGILLFPPNLLGLTLSKIQFIEHFGRRHRRKHKPPGKK